VPVSRLYDGGRSDGVGTWCEYRPLCGWVLWRRVLSWSLGVGGGFVWMLTLAYCSRNGIDGGLCGVNLCALFEIWVVCFCVSMGVQGVGYCPVPVPVRCGTLVVGQSCTGGVLCCGNVADSRVPVLYRYGTVRYVVGEDFGTLRAGSGSTGTGAVCVRFRLSLDGSEWDSIVPVRCVGVPAWYCCGLVAILVSFFGWESLVCV
jgi:hypothetical protein